MVLQEKTKLHLVEGEQELMEGVTVLPTYGHTVGHQVVKLDSGELENLPRFGKKTVCTLLVGVGRDRLIGNVNPRSPSIAPKMYLGAKWVPGSPKLAMTTLQQYSLNSLNFFLASFISSRIPL